MKNQNPTLKQKIIDLLSETDKPMRCGEIATQVHATGRVVSSTLRNMITDGSYPRLRRVGMAPGFRYIANDKVAPPAPKKKSTHVRPQHPIMQDLWRGWGDAPCLGKGYSSIVEDLYREP